MSVDLKLMNWIKLNRGKMSRTEIIEKLKEEGHAEKNVIDTYNEVVKSMSSTSNTEIKSMVATIILSILFPGIGHMYTKAVGIGALILTLYIVGIILNVTLFGAVIGVPLCIAMFIWGLTGSIVRCGKINRGEI